MGGKICYKIFQRVLALTKFAKFNVISNHQGQQEQHKYRDILSNNLVIPKVNEQTMVRALSINLDSFTSKLEYEYQNLTQLTEKINIFP
jgi:beta-N-acetylglucosaminidase